MNSFRIHTILSLLNLKGIGPAFIGKYESLIKEGIDARWDIAKILEGAKKGKYQNAEIDSATSKASEIIQLAKASAIKVIDIWDKSYPQKLRENGLKWPVIYCKGNVQFESTSVGVIGSRAATAVGATIAERLGSYFSEHECIIINGVAQGIDAASIKDKKVKQCSIGIIPGGLAFDESKTLSRDYLEEANMILEAGGGLVSAFEPTAKQDQFKVVEYCKMQAALSDVLILVQSTIEGGSRFTLEAFSRLNRPLGIVNALKYDKTNEGSYSANELLLKKGKEGLSELCGISEDKIKCSLIDIQDKEDYAKVLDRLHSGHDQRTLF